MEDMQLALTAARVDQKNFGVWLRNWQVGQMLNALVTAQRPTGDLVLRVAGQQITARADIPVQQGTHLLLEIRQLQPQVLLRIVAANPSGMATPRDTPVAGELRLLALTTGVVDARRLDQVASGLRSGDLPVTLAPSVQRLLASLPSLAELLRPAGLRRALQGSGTLLEPTLVSLLAGAKASPSGSEAARSPPGRDLKGQLLSLFARVNAELAAARAAAAGARGDASIETLTALRRQLESVLGGIVVNQLQSQPESPAGPRAWRFDLPFLLEDVVHNLQVRIEQDAPGHGASYENEAQKGDETPRHDAWRVVLDLDLPSLGPMSLRVRLQDAAVSIQLAARDDGTRELFSAHAAELARGLEQQGMAPTQIDVVLLRDRHATGASGVADPAARDSARGWRA
jgi:hypothetical protein